MAGQRPIVFTVGHSNHPLPAFLALLHRFHISAIADVRSVPASGRFPHFNAERLRLSLLEAGVAYVPLGREFGARREEAECYIDGQVNFALAAKTDAFQEGVERLQNGAQRFSVALMCAEREPLDCHRALLICRYTKHLFDFQHIHADGHLESQSAMEQRLVELTKVEAALWDEAEESVPLVDQAYDKRASTVAYRRAK